MLSNLFKPTFALRRSLHTTQLFINGQFINSKSTTFVDVHNPATQELVTRTPIALQSELELAVKSASNAYLTWKDVPVSTRQRVMFKYQELIRKSEDEIVKAIVNENGKTVADAKGDIFRGS